MPQKHIITTSDEKMTILNKARSVGFGMTLSCPDGLVSTEKGIRIAWYGAIKDESNVIKYQFLLSLSKKKIEDFDDNSALKSFLDSLEDVSVV